jgi:transcriptional antiterminator RfaH
MNWYCIHTRPQKEDGAANYLSEMLGIETYFPRLKREKIIRRAKRVVVGPLFPRYFFCHFDFAHRYRAVRYAPDVVEIVSFGNVPAVVDDSLIDGLKTWAGDAVDVLSIQPSLHPGDKLEIIDGPLRGLQAVLLHEMDGRERVSVVLSILERTVHAMISRCQLAPVR